MRRPVRAPSPFPVAASLVLLSLGALGPSAAASPGHAQEGDLYRAVTVRAAPGRLVDLIDLYREEMELAERVGDEPAMWMRHSQGDHWDLLLLYPMGDSMAEHYAPGRMEARRTTRTPSGRSGAELARAIGEATAWREEVFVRGPRVDEVRARWAGAGFFHLEMFQGLPGKRAELVRQREMENDYLRRIGRDANLIFVREAGAATDIFTLGFYRDLQHYAEPSQLSDEERDQAARDAGFEGRGRIGTYLRTLISRHHDTLGVRVE